PEGRTLKAIQPGGPLSGIVPASHVDIPLEPEPFRELGSLMGAGGLVILDDTNGIVDLCIYFEWFAEDESCGRCTTCFAGTRRMLEILRRISSGRGRLADLELIKLLGSIAQNANCFHGQGAPTAVMSMFRFFEGELLEHVERKRCPAKVCRGLVRYEVLHHSDRLPAAEAICPTNAVVRDNGTYRIDQLKCIKCAGRRPGVRTTKAGLQTGVPSRAGPAQPDASGQPAPSTLAVDSPFGWAAALYRSIVDTSPDAITVTTIEGKIILCNQQAATLH